jgi:hypothetical protein
MIAEFMMLFALTTGPAVAICGQEIGTGIPCCLTKVNDAAVFRCQGVPMQVVLRNLKIVKEDDKSPKKRKQNMMDKKRLAQ